MKTLFTLTEYNLRAIRKPLFWTLLLMGPVEFVVMVAGMLMRRGPLYALPSTFYLDGMFITAACMIAAAVLNFFAANQQSGRSKGIYTLMTLPARRSWLFFSTVLSGFIAVFLVIFAQAVWYLLLHLPMCWANQVFSDSYLHSLVEAGRLPQLPGYSSFVHNGLFLSMMRAKALRLLMPLNLTGLVYLLVTVLCPIACLQATLYRRGGMKVLHILLFCYSIFATLLGLVAGISDYISLVNGQSHSMMLFYCLHQLVLTTLVSFSACYGLTRSKNL